jgi:hypothetical protein
MTRTLGAAVGAVLIIVFMAMVASRLSSPPVPDAPVASLADPRR